MLGLGILWVLQSNYEQILSLLFQLPSAIIRRKLQELACHSRMPCLVPNMKLLGIVEYRTLVQVAVVLYRRLCVDVCSCCCAMVCLSMHEQSSAP
jgi:hypothetical protein